MIPLLLPFSPSSSDLICPHWDCPQALHNRRNSLSSQFTQFTYFL